MRRKSIGTIVFGAVLAASFVGSSAEEPVDTADMHA